MLLGVDTGGTFTDFVLYDGQKVRIHKVLSTPASPEQAILQGINDLGLTDLLDNPLQSLYIIHGSTVATNAVLEGKGVKTAYICNDGFRDLLTIGRQTRAELYNLRPALCSSPVPEELCFEVDGRITDNGKELAALSEKCLQQLKIKLNKAQPQAVAINLLFSFLDARHEEAIKKIIPDGIFISCSSDVLPEYKEYERGIATWLNAWVGPIMQTYLSQLNTSVKQASLSVMQSSGGTIAVDQKDIKAVHLLLSGPAGGLAGAQYMAACSGYQQLLSFDMGGTSTDVALIDGELQLTNEGRIGPYPVAVSMVDLHTIGAGGGSIAFVDEGGLLHVGPASAGADPGPACYGRGAKQATVTDANLVLGRLRTDAFLGGKMQLDNTAAQVAIQLLAEKLQISSQQTAQGIIDVVNENMVRALRVMSVQRGFDADKLTLISFGGAGGLHVCALAKALKMRRAIVPIHAGVLSALGMIVAPRARFLSKSLICLLTKYDRKQLAKYFDELIESASEALKTEGIEKKQIKIEKSADLRYCGQSYTLNIKWPTVPSLDNNTVSEVLTTIFHEAHASQYGHSLQQPIELINLRVKVTGPQTELAIKQDDRSVNVESDARTIVDSLVLVKRESMTLKDKISGPALIIETVSTTFVDKGWRCKVDTAGNLILECM